MSEILTYKDTEVYINSYTWKKLSDIHRVWKCPMCYKHIKENDQVYLLINNHKHFPNTLLHKECFEENDKDNLFGCIENEYLQIKRREDMF